MNRGPILPVAFALVSAFCSTTPAQVRSTRTVRFATGTPGGGFYPVGQGLARAYARLMPDVKVEVHATPGAVANVEAIQRGDADLGIAFADVAYIAYIGRLNGAAEPFDRLRGVAMLQLTPVHLVVGRDTGIASVSDLRGRRIGVGPPGSGTGLTAELILQAFGIRPEDTRAEPLPFNDAARRLIDGSLDAMFDNAIFPAESVRMATEAGARLLPLTGHAIERLRQEYPFLRLTVIPRETYPALAGPVHTIGVDSLLVCRSTLDEAIVYDLTRRFFDALPSLSSTQDALRFMDVEQAPATPIPLHDGAARYYRERELLR
jgi:uncharacterized protein